MYLSNPILAVLVLSVMWDLHPQVFHAGTATNEAGELVASGGRVLGVTALGADVAEAQRKAYEVHSFLGFKG